MSVQRDRPTGAPPDTAELRELGRRVQQVRYARGKSLRVIAGLAGMSKSTLWRIECGYRPLERPSEIAALATALRVAPSELTTQPQSPPDHGQDAAVAAVRRALIAVSQDDPAGQTLPVDGLRRRVATLTTPHRHCDHDQVGCELPALIRDLHTTLASTGGDRRLLLAGTVLLHVQGTHAHLHHVGAPVDLCWQAVLLARHAACDHAGPTLRGLVALAAATALLAAGELDIAQAELDAAPPACTDPASLPVAGMLTLTSALVAAADKRPDDADAALTHAAQLASHTAQASGYGLDFAPATVELWRLLVALETRDYPRAATVAGQLRPEQLTTHRSATYWAGYGQALARLRDRHDDAVRALYRAEQLCPAQVQRNPAIREVLAELLVHSRRDAIGRELRAMAYRAGLSA